MANLCMRSSIVFLTAIGLDLQRIKQAAGRQVSFPDRFACQIDRDAIIFLCRA